VLEGAVWSGNHLRINDGDSVRLEASQVRWVQATPTETPHPSTLSMVNLPVYLNGDRSDTLFTVELPFEDGLGNLVAMRAVCLTAGG
jgi:dynein heavy chain 1, cytosolic